MASEVIVHADAAAAALAVAAEIGALVARDPRAALGVATGSSPEPVYDALAQATAAGLDFSAVSAFALDEYVGVPATQEQSYRAVIDRQLTRRLGLDPDRVHVPDGTATDLIRAAASYEERIHAAGGIELQLLGIGHNGHIGFNEPGSAFDSRTRVVTLTAETRAANSRFFASPAAVPREALTQGLGTIMEARSAVLIATGRSKAQAVRRAVLGPVSPDCPASVLQRHPRARFHLDREAASLLTAAAE